MRGLLPSGRWPTALAAASALAAWWFLFAFHGVTDIGYLAHKQNPSAFRWLYGRWLVDWHQTSYSLNFLAVPLAAWLAWRRRGAWAHAPSRVCWPALAIVLAALALHVFGAKAQQTRLSLLALFLLWWAIPAFAWGGALLRALAYPTLVLLLSMPLNFFDQLLNPMRIAAARAAAVLASGVGLGVQAVGSVLMESETRAWAVDLADPTSSVYALFACMLLAVFVAELSRLKPARRLLVVALSPLAFLLATVARGVALCLWSEFASPGSAARIDEQVPALVLLPGFLLFLWMAVRLARLNAVDFRARLRSLMEPTGEANPSRDREGLP